MCFIPNTSNLCCQVSACKPQNKFSWLSYVDLQIKVPHYLVIVFTLFVQQTVHMNRSGQSAKVLIFFTSKVNWNIYSIGWRKVSLKIGTTLYIPFMFHVLTIYASVALFTLLPSTSFHCCLNITALLLKPSITTWQIYWFVCGLIVYFHILPSFLPSKCITTSRALRPLPRI